MAGFILLLGLGAFFALIGSVSLATAGREYPGAERSGTLVDATASRGRRSNSTTFMVEDAYGELLEFRVNSSIRVNEVRRIRTLARSARGEEVLFLDDRRQGDLLEMRTTEGRVIVSRQHVRAAKAFTGWGMVATGILFLLISVFGLKGLSRKRQ